ncbi:MAG TPA: asparagine synthase-related protein, partial [Terriglobia bacterium]|nr:asparagine synthase-related protein [Terriglobia bacterium]
MMLARDRVGIKPLYYHHSSSGIVFGSEIKAILADPNVRTEARPELIDRFLTFYYTPGEETLFKNVLKLEPGCILLAERGKVETRRYWDLKFPESTLSLNFEDAKKQLLEMLEEAVRIHMISDVPIGFLLSGGVDSTAMLSLARNKTDKPISSFTVGFSGESIPDERPYARLAAERFGTRHYDISISASEFQGSLEKYVWHMEEPVCEPPAIALYHVSKLAREHVKVLISGEGGDEAFGGYPDYRNYVWLERIKKVLGPFKGLLSRTMSAANHNGNSSRMDKYAALLTIPLQNYYYSRSSNPFTYFNSSDRIYTRDFAAHVDKSWSANPASQLLSENHFRDNLSRMLYVDTKTWLPDDLLIKADKITMA